MTGLSSFARGLQSILDAYQRRAGKPADYVVLGSEANRERVANALRALDYDAHIIVDTGFSRGYFMVGCIEDRDKLDGIAEYGMGDV